MEEEINQPMDELVEEPSVQVIVLMNQVLLISKIQEVLADIGQPDCRLINPYIILSKDNMIPWLSEFTEDNEVMISSDKILTLVEPNKTLLNAYLEKTQ